MAADEKQLAFIEQVLAECEGWLGVAEVGPAVRELRVRHGMLERVVVGWTLSPPHGAQAAAMLECVTELRALIQRTCSPAPGAATARRRSTRPPPHRGSVRPLRSRSTRPPPHPNFSQRPTRPPPKPSGD